MYNGYNKIFWGIFVTSFHINFGIIKILPRFVGFLIILSGIKEVYEQSKIDEFEDAKNLSIIMAIVAFIGEGIGFFTQTNIGYSLIGAIWTIFYISFEFVFFFKLLEASIEYLNVNNYQDEEVEYISKLRRYIVFTIINIVLISIALIFNLPMYNTIAGIIAIVLRIYLITIIYGFRNIFPRPEIIEEE